MTPSHSLVRKIVASILCVALGLVFIFSGLSKIPTLEQFGWTIVETTPLNWTLAEWSARLLIGLELFLGILFIGHLKIRKIAIPVSFVLLLIFTIYLLLVIRVQGSSGNCGCFGEVLPMTPLQSVYKNLGMLLILVLIYFIQHEWTFKYTTMVLWILLLISVSMPFFFNPPESIYINEKEQRISKPIPLSLLYQSSQNPAPAVELRQGKHVIAFMSLSCEFCRKAAKRMRIMKEKHPEIPFYIILNGDSSKLAEFFEDTRAGNIEHSMFNGAEQFSMMNDGIALPGIKWVHDTTVVRESNWVTMDEIEILDWLKE